MLLPNPSVVTPLHTVLCRLPPGDWLPEPLRPGAARPDVQYVAVAWLRDSIGKGCWLPVEGYDPEEVAAAEAQAAAAAAAAAEVPPMPQLQGHPDRCVGSLLGVMIGDCLGRPFQYASRREWSYIRWSLHLAAVCVCSCVGG